MHGATALAEVADNGELESFLVETSGAGYIVHIQRRFKDAINFGTHRDLPADYPTVSNPAHSENRSLRHVGLRFRSGPTRLHPFSSIIADISQTTSVARVEWVTKEAQSNV